MWVWLWGRLGPRCKTLPSLTLQHWCVCVQGVAISEAGTSLSEMLQTETILDARRHRTESTSSTSSVLTSLLQFQGGDSTTVAVATPKQASTSQMLATSPTLTKILQSDQVTSSTEMALAAQRSQQQTMSPDSSSTSRSLAEILMQKESAPLPPQPPAIIKATPAVSVSDKNITLTQVLTGPNPIVQSASKKLNSEIRENPTADEMRIFIENKPEASASPAFFLGEDTDSALMEIGSASTDMDTFSLFGLEDSAMFENGWFNSEMKFPQRNFSKCTYQCFLALYILLPFIAQVTVWFRPAMRTLSSTSVCVCMMIRYCGHRCRQFAGSVWRRYFMFFSTSVHQVSDEFLSSNIFYKRNENFLAGLLKCVNCVWWI